MEQITKYLQKAQAYFLTLPESVQIGFYYLIAACGNQIISDLQKQGFQIDWKALTVLAVAYIVNMASYKAASYKKEENKDIK